MFSEVVYLYICLVAESVIKYKCLSVLIYPTLTKRLDEIYLCLFTLALEVLTKLK